MKKILKSFIIIIVFLMFINVKASTTFTNTPKFVNDYIKNFPNYQRYIVTENKDYGFLSGNIQSGISGFKNGGLLNIDEYKISKSRGNNTYLFNGLEFFTMTFDGGKIQVIDPNSNNGISQKNENEASGIRVTNYVQNGVKLEGRGTLVDPWKFIDRYNLQFYYDDTKITIKPSSVMVPESGNVTVDIIPSSTYRYASDDCGGIFNNDKLTVNNISSDMICNVEVGLREFEVTVDANEGIVTNANGWDLNIDLKSATKKIIYNSKIGTLPIVERTGYNFVGWYTDAEGGTPVDANTIVKGELNAYARWEGIDYTLTYDNNGGSGCTSKTAKYNSTWGELCTPNKTGYSFDYWYDASENRVTSSTKVTGNLTVTAHWTAKKPTVTFEVNGGSVSPTSKTVTYDQKYGSLPTPTKSGSTFAGWYKESSLTNLIDSETIVQTETNHTLYARWLTNISAVTTSLCLNPTYNGSGQRIVSTAGTGYKWTDGETKIDAGSQDVTATLQSGYIWSDGTTGTKTISCSIQPKSVEVTWGSTTSFVYTGSAQGPTASATTGVNGETMTVTATTQTNVGSYTASASCSSVSGGRAKCGNYTLTGTKAFTINNVTITFNKGDCSNISGTTPLYTRKGASALYSGATNSTSATAPKGTTVNGKYFAGWYTASSGGSKVLNANGSLTGTAVSGYTTTSAFAMTENKTLYARCSCALSVDTPDGTSFGDDPCGITDDGCMREFNPKFTNGYTPSSDSEITVSTSSSLVSVFKIYWDRIDVDRNDNNTSSGNATVTAKHTISGCTVSRTFTLAAVDCSKDIPHCTKCTTVCTECASGYKVSAGKCVEKQKIGCVAGTYLNSSNSCEQCPAGYYCSGGTYTEDEGEQGLTKCPTGKTSNKGAKKASACYWICSGVSNCTSCSGENYCGTCKSGYYQSSGKCYSCSSHCTACSSSSNCTSCSSGYHVSGGYCAADLGSGGGGGCFTKGTKVMTIFGPKDINEITDGTLVLTYNEETGKQEYSRVKHHIELKNLDETLYTFKFDDMTKLDITHLHRVYVIRDNKEMYISAEELKLFDKVLYADGSTHSIIGISKQKYNKPVYNIEVENNHNFYVGDSNILVHNVVINIMSAVDPNNDILK
ncbi:MAG: InlB B-repeat-containing protein [Bacilli bacterium]|nr:InlB B-repeat-containing protein [Bacilli bacterium]